MQWTPASAFEQDGMTLGCDDQAFDLNLWGSGQRPHRRETPVHREKETEFDTLTDRKEIEARLTDTSNPQQTHSFTTDTPTRTTHSVPGCFSQPDTLFSHDPRALSKKKKQMNFDANERPAAVCVCVSTPSSGRQHTQLDTKLDNFIWGAPRFTHHREGEDRMPNVQEFWAWEVASVGAVRSPGCGTGSRLWEPEGQIARERRPDLGAGSPDCLGRV